MPNWCYTQNEIKASRNSLDMLEKELRKATASNPLKSDFGNNWLGNLLIHIGKSKDEVIYGPIRCRGEILDIFRYQDNILRISTDSSWGPHVSCIKEFCDHFIKNAEITYIAEEEMSELYWTNDKNVAGTVYCRWYEDANERFSAEMRNLLERIDDVTVSEAKKELENYFGRTFDSFDDAADALAESEEFKGENEIDLNVYEYIPIGSDT